MYPYLLTLALATLVDSTVVPDGPYLIYEDEGVQVKWADTENRVSNVIDWNELDKIPEGTFPNFRPEFVDIDREFTADKRVAYDGIERVAALSDIHGQYETARALLQKHGIIDEHLNWSWGDGHLVIVGDVFDRGDEVNQLLWMIHNLQFQAADAGGKLHFLLGNHETMIMEGDERYINKRYRLTTALLGSRYTDLYGPDTYLGRWLRSLPLTVKINGNVFIHGGLSRAMIKELPDLQKINKLYREYVIDADNLAVVKADNERIALVHGASGPLWYRGYFVPDEFDGKDLSYVLKKIDAKRMVVGHTSFEAIKSYYDGRIIAVDSSIKFGGRGEILFITDGKLFRGDLMGKTMALEASDVKP